MVRFPAGFVLIFFVLQLCSGMVFAASEHYRAQGRSDYQEAVTAVKSGGWKDFQKIRSGLDSYPLAIYLDYYKLSENVRNVRPVEVQRFVSATQDSPLPNRYLAVYLNQAGRDRRWQDFLAVMPDEPNAIELKCYYFRAKLGLGDALAAWEGAEKLWVHGESRPKQCDPLFSAWLKADQLSDDLIWARMLKAFDARQRSLLQYIARKSSSELQPWSDKLLAVYAQPDRIKRQNLPASDPYSADIATHGLAYLARYSPERALEYWQYYLGALTFTQPQTEQVEYAIALQSLFAKTKKNILWLDQSLGRIADDKLTGLRLRWQLGEQDWGGMAKTLPHLSQLKSEEAVWRYWGAIIEEAFGGADRAKETMAALSLERGYYSFLAADRLGKAYAFNNKPLVLASEKLTPLKDIPAVQRVEELFFHEEERLAHAEWFYILEDNDAQTREELGSLASQQGWHRMAIDAANKAKAWDRLDLRFPMPWTDMFKHYASLQQIPNTELMAIARRESAFFPQASSPVGARGLMQLMPATGKEVASSLGKRHRNADLYEVDHNVLLGSTYYKQLLDRYGGNRVFALTAYNAGPHRVDRWRHKAADAVPVEIWVETIPYKETRNYVQAVLSYNVVFKHLLGQDSSILTPAELQAKY